MSQFYISAYPPDEDVRRCEASMATSQPLLITGAADGVIRMFEGIVQFLEDHGADAPQALRWRVTIKDRK